MSLRLNLCPNGMLSPALGYPFTLGAQTDTYCTGVIPLWAASIAVSVKADKQADFHMALYSAPLVRGGTDGPLLLQVDTTAVLNAYQTIALTVPALAPGAAIIPDGTITITSATTSVSGAATAFPSDGQWNGMELSTKGGAWAQISSVTSATALTLVAAATASSAGAFYVRRPQAAAYVLTMWCDNVVGSTVETVIRDPAVTVASTQPQIPGGVTIASVVVS